MDAQRSAHPPVYPLRGSGSRRLGLCCAATLEHPAWKGSPLDADGFDILARSLTVTGSRRRALLLPLSGVFVSLLRGEAWQAAHAAKNCKKIKNKKKRKKCLAKAGMPNCDRKLCGDDGCGGSCGTCAGNEACQAGRCVCVANCSNRVCGSDGCTGSCGTGNCSVTGQSCTAAGRCVCPEDSPDICDGACRGPVTRPSKRATRSPATAARPAPNCVIPPQTPAARAFASIQHRLSPFARVWGRTRTATSMRSARVAGVPRFFARRPAATTWAAVSRVTATRPS